MSYDNETSLRETLLIICLFKLFHDNGIWNVQNRYYGYDLSDMDFFYEIVVDALDSAAPIVINDEYIYKKYGLDLDECNVYAYSSNEMQQCFKLARKIYRLEGCKQKENPYMQDLEKKIEQIRNFASYSFDYNIGSILKNPQLEVIWWYEFGEEIYMCLWIVRVMQLMREELPILQKKYRDVRRKVRADRNRMRKGGIAYAA